MTTQYLTKNWILKGSSLVTPIATHLPNDVHSILLQEGLIPDPYYACNENEVQWVGQKDWQLQCEFDDKTRLKDNAHQWLVVTQLDTHASITLNGTEVVRGCNMFAEYAPEISDYLISTGNQMTVDLFSAPKEAARRSELLPFPIPWARNNNVPHMNLLRKPQCHTGWDWGISLCVAGIYKAPYIVSDDNARLSNMTCHQHHKEGRVSLDISVLLQVATAGKRTLALEFDGQLHEIPVLLQVGQQTITHRIEVEHPKLWWPVGYGEQPLYDLNIRFGNQVHHQRIGLRDLQLINEPDEVGTSFIIRVNGTDIFCKGANWIPSDALPARQNPNRYRQLLQDACNAGMNMIRIWGGGQYEHDAFYDICDELGILLWHDLMFACALYPSEGWFLNEVKAELEYQIPRLQHRTSIALWCGDNEVIGALDWYDESQNNRDTYLVNYDRLNRFCGGLVKNLDPSRSFWTSSPSNGSLDFGDGWHVDTKGDMHYWTVWHDGASFDAFRSIKPRFCSEFGFQSFSSLPQVREFAPEDQFNITSPVMEHHQKNDRGNSIMNEMFSRLFRMPGSFSGQLWLSQLQQALAIETGVLYWRSLRPICMGMTYWQLNDNWPVASWASMEYNGRWKLLHHFAKRFYASKMLSLQTTATTIFVNALMDDVKGGILRGSLTQFRFTDGQQKTWPLEAVFEQPGATELLQLPITDLPYAAEESFLYLDFKESEAASGQSAFACHPKQLNLPIPQIRASLEENQGTWMLELVSDVPAFYVTAELSHAKRPFSDNGVCLLPNTPIRLGIPEDAKPEKVLSDLRLYDLASYCRVPIDF